MTTGVLAARLRMLTDGGAYTSHPFGCTLEATGGPSGPQNLLRLLVSGIISSDEGVEAGGIGFLMPETGSGGSRDYFLVSGSL